MNKLILKRDKHIIYINNEKDKSHNQLRYDLIKKQMEKYYYDKGEWKVVKHQYEFFSKFSISSIECEEEHFKKLIELAAKINLGCVSVSTFITRLDEVLPFENYIWEEIPFDLYAIRDYYGSIQKRGITKPLSFYNKNVVRFFKEFGIKITEDVENAFINNQQFLNNVIETLQGLEINRNEKQEIFNYIIRASRYAGTENGGPIKKLLTIHNYDLKALINYIYGYLKPFENFTDVQDILETLEDYYRMAKVIGRDVKKYPKYLRSMHDIITSNFNAYKREYNNLLFTKQMQPQLEFEGEEYSIVIPRSPKDIIQEGTDLNHCVGSYVDKIIEGQTYICFLRITKQKDKSLVTLEYKNGSIVQAKGAYNRQLSKEEKEFLENYCKKVKVRLEV